MFRDDRCSIERPVEIEEEGETIGWTDEIIAVDIPCHLSVESIPRRRYIRGNICYNP